MWKFIAHKGRGWFAAIGGGKGSRGRVVKRQLRTDGGLSKKRGNIHYENILKYEKGPKKNTLIWLLCFAVGDKNSTCNKSMGTQENPTGNSSKKVQGSMIKFQY